MSFLFSFLFCKIPLAPRTLIELTHGKEGGPKKTRKNAKNKQIHVVMTSLRWRCNVNVMGSAGHNLGLVTAAIRRRG